jgi:hypothetical protein
MNYRILILSLCFISFAGFLCFGQSKQVILTINHNGGGELEIKTAPLKYNKDFAFSFTFDDARIDSYHLGYRLLNGGTSEVDGNTYPGLFFTNGCGRLIRFNAGIAWYTASTNGTDLHNGNNTAYLTYSHALQMHENAWQFFNHSYDHASDEPNINYLDQLTRNNQSFNNRVGVALNYVIPPGGDTNYIEPAFSFGSPAVFTTNGSYSQSPGVPIRVDEPIISKKPVFWRHQITSDDDTASELLNTVNSFFKDAGNDNHLWWNEFTHRVQYDQYAGSFKFEEFRKYMEGLEAEYGRYGDDNGLFVNSTEVFEYLIVRDKIEISKSRSGNQERIVLDFSNCPGDFRYYDLTLLISGVSVNSMNVTSPATMSYSSKTGYYLVNIEMPESYYSGIESKFVFSNETNVYPNPADNYFIISSQRHLTEPLEVKMISISGQIIKPEFSVIGSDKIRVDNLKTFLHSGLYMVVIENGKMNHLIDKILIN